MCNACITVDTMSNTDTVTIVGNDGISDIASSGGIFYRLSNCCKASATGSGNVTACRSCYREIGSEFGQAWTTSEDLELWTGIKA
jgi:hypothetical protein